MLAKFGYYELEKII